MDVYLVPVGPQRHELYCEIPDTAEPGAEARSGFFRRMVQRFREMVAEAERERRQGRQKPLEGGWFSRVRMRTMRWVAETIAEQRLLWHLRKQTEACLHYPDDLEQATADELLREQLRRDFEKHRFWLALDFLIFLATGVLALVPGPNLLAYYFAFRVVGHYLSLRGAERGLGLVTWRFLPSAPLAELRSVLSMAPSVRQPRVHAVAESLRLEHLVSFFERSAVST